MNSPAMSQAEKFGRLAWESMKANNVAATPANYSIWFHYHAGGNPQLNRAIDILAANNRVFDDAVLEELNEQFFGGVQTEESVLETSEQLQSVVNNVMDTVQFASEGAGAFGTALETFSGDIDQMVDDDLKGVVSSIVGETRKIEAQNQKLHLELNSYSDEINRLRQDLEYVRREARTDALTGLANRKFFDTFLRDATAEAAENNQELCMLINDVDHFKSFNDTYGHQLGDQVLKVVAGIMQENTKGKDLAARYGGEEFCVILPNTSLKDACKVAEMIREAVSVKKIVKKRTGEELRQITISVGVAKFVYGEPVTDLIARADKAMYTAKEAGRNRVISENDIDDSVLQST